MNKVVCLSLLLCLIWISTGGAEPANGSGPGLTYGYGVFGTMLILPTPFAECGVSYGRLALRGNVSYIIAYLDARAELALLGLNSARSIDVFANYGRNSVIQTGYGYVYGAGVDYNPRSKSWFFRTELGWFEADDNDGQVLPRIGIGWRY